MSVFISHRTSDDRLATVVRARLRRHGISAYADHFDDAADSTRDITGLLVREINHCSHLIAIVTSETTRSWWVPFEIGVARQGNRRITTYTRFRSILPAFLKEWPVVSSLDELAHFARAYDEDSKRRIIALDEQADSRARITSPDKFHRQLKTALTLSRRL